MHTPNQIKQPGYEVDQIGIRAEGSGRRSYVRYPVTLDAILLAAGGRHVPCVVRDFCLGGMLLRYKQHEAKGQPISFGADDALILRCAVPDAGERKILQFQARVVRNVPDGLGLAFINPARDSLQLMQNFALQFSSAVGGNQAQNIGEANVKNNKAAPLGRRFSDVVAGCGRIAQETMDFLLDRLSAKLASHLFELSRDATNPAAQNVFYNASEAIKINNDKLLGAIRLGFQERSQADLSGFLDPQKPQEQQAEDLSLENLSLVGDEDLGEWLAVSDVTNKIEERYKEALTTLEERLSFLFNVPISHANNPYGPALFAESFQVGLAQFKFQESVNSACYAVLKEILVTILSDLYEKLNGILIEYGILPKLKYKVVRPPASSGDRPEVPAAPSAAPDPAASARGSAAPTDIPARRQESATAVAKEANARPTSPASHAEETSGRPSIRSEPSTIVDAGIASARPISPASDPEVTAGQPPFDNEPVPVAETEEVNAPPEQTIFDIEEISEPSTFEHASLLEAEVEEVNVPPEPQIIDIEYIVEYPTFEHEPLPVADSQESSARPPPPISHPKRAAAHSAVRHEPPPDLYHVIQDLRALRQDLSLQRAAIMRGTPNSAPGISGLTGTAPLGQETTDYYSTSELLDAVAHLQSNPKALGIAEGQFNRISSRVLASLAARSHGGQEKGLNPRDSNVLEVANDLLNAMEHDPLVAESVKPWIRQLELPILKLALQDPSLFFDQSHIVRQVINSMAKLDIFREEKSASNQNSTGAVIGKLLERIMQEHTDVTEIFSEIQAMLDKFIQIQGKAYEDNLQDVIRECQKATPVPDAYNYEGVEEGAPSDSEIRKWIMLARRLREGDDVLFSFRDNSPQRLRVAWIDELGTVYVFVDLQGIKDKVLKTSDVARMMHLGILKPVHDAADPAMDRAQYALMQDLYKQVVHQSTHDSLTGLINRREFERRLGEAVATAKSDDLRHVLIFIDVDNFSAVNNNCGYVGGDKLLQDLVGILKDGLSGKGEIGRIGSDEFGILIEKCSLDDALAVTERQIADVTNYRLSWEEKIFSVSLSIGIVPISAASGSAVELLRSAESSCAIAKDTGGNRLQVFHSGHARISHHDEVMKWVGKIDKILEEGSLEIRCQRIEPVDGDGLLRPHYEILLGVKDEQGNVGPPGEFIKAAEWYRKMSAVDRYVITKTLSWMENNPEVLETIAGFAINLSGQSLNEEGFIDFILEHLEAVRVPREKICFEVTETVGIANLSDATSIIQRIKDAGCSFSLDDFGSGMSSYGYLKNLPVDVVKIDGAFVKDLVYASSDYAVVKSITEIAHFMKKRVVAEFVESSEALEILREIGVDYVQGYLIDKPGPLDRLLLSKTLH